MSDAIKHECGIALLRLRKPLDFYLDKYGTALYGMNKMVLMMEKQHNRGQDGAGLAGVKLDMPPGQRYLTRYRSVAAKPMQDIYQRMQDRIMERVDGQPERLKDAAWVKANIPVACEVYLGHMRYGTYGGNTIEACHPFLRQSNYMSRNLIVAGNFNMTNVGELMNELVDLGQHPKVKADTVTIMEKIGHYLDKENKRLHADAKSQGMDKPARARHIAEHLELQRVLQKASRQWDGGYAMGGMVGQGDSFLFRDPNGIRPAYYYADDEIVVVASERPVIQTAFNVPFEAIKEVPPGNAIIVRRDGSYALHEILAPQKRLACSFERIYFSRGNDGDIYRERIELGRRLAKRTLDFANYDFERTVFSFIPNTAEISYLGLCKGAEDELNAQKARDVLALGDGATAQQIEAIMGRRPRMEKIAWKDVKLRTFITEDSGRDDMVAHVYDSTYNVVGPEDNLVAMDDSIVRGTTLEKSILGMLDRLNPKRIIIVSSAPQIRYPDCYGIDMARMGDFAAFRAAVSLIEKRGLTSLMDEVYQAAKAELEKPKEEQVNVVKAIYEPFTADEISEEIAKMLTPDHVQAEVKLVYQTIEDLHASCPDNQGDWYFTGNYPTAGGTRVANKSYVHYIEGNRERAY